jgi:hypothetical protein
MGERVVAMSKDPGAGANWRATARRGLAGQAAGHDRGPAGRGELGLTGRGAGWWAGRMAGPVGFVGREGELPALPGALDVMPGWCWWWETPGWARPGW